MSNISQYYQYEAERVDNGAMVEGYIDIITKGAYLAPIQNGYYIATTVTLENGEMILCERFEVKPETIRRAAMKPIDKYYCPNCKQILHGMVNHCDHCGMAINWN